MRRLRPVVALVAVTALVAACTPCNRDGCDAMVSAAAQSGHSGIAGIVASESDVVSNGCQQCRFGVAALGFWKAGAPVTDAAAAKALVAAGPAAAKMQANERYETALDPGSYLACTQLGCAAVEVVAGRVTTVNARVINGPPQFMVVDGGGGAAHAAATLEVGLANGSLL